MNQSTSMPDHGILGDETGVNLPQANTSEHEEALNELKKKAKYSRSKEFGELKEKMEARIDFYKKFMPDGTSVALKSQKDVSQWWRLAVIIIAELQQVIDMYEGAETELKAIEKELQ